METIIQWLERDSPNEVMRRAIETDTAEVVDVFLQRRLPIRPSDLASALLAESTAVVERMIELAHCDVDAKTRIGRPLFFLAVQNTKMLECFLRNGVNPNMYVWIRLIRLIRLID